VGVTIHWQGKLIGAEAYTALIQMVRNFAATRHWPVQEIELGTKRLERVIDEQDLVYEGLTFGVVLWPHPDCEPVTFEFDEGLFTQEYCKTQFAGADVHMELIALLRLAAPHFLDLVVEDEGEFWESGDVDRLRGHLDHISSVLAEWVANDPEGKSPVVLPSGRVADFTGRKKP
jgi:hypothetical protein